MDKVFVVIPMYNSQKQIDGAIQSVLGQKNVNVELVLVDHGSSDNTLEYVNKKYSMKENVCIIPLKRIPNERRSASRPLNAGMKYVSKHSCSTDWVMRLDSDDVLVNEHSISSALKASTKGIQIISGSMYFIDTSNQTAQEYKLKPEYSSLIKLKQGAAYAYPHHASLISTRLIKKLISHDGYIYYQRIGYGEDLDVTLRLMNFCKTGEICFSNIPMIIKELSGNTITNSIDFKTIMHDHYWIFKRNRDLSKYLYCNIVLWYLMDYSGSIGKFINKRRIPPALKYSCHRILNFKNVLSMKQAWITKR